MKRPLGQFFFFSLARFDALVDVKEERRSTPAQRPPGYSGICDKNTFWCSTKPTRGGRSK